MNDINDALKSSNYRRRMSDSDDRSLGEIRGKQDILKADWSREPDVSRFTRLRKGQNAKFNRERHWQNVTDDEDLCLYQCIQAEVLRGSATVLAQVRYLGV